MMVGLGDTLVPMTSAWYEPFTRPGVLALFFGALAGVGAGTFAFKRRGCRR